MQPFVTAVPLPDPAYGQHALRVVQQVGIAGRFGFYPIQDDPYFGALRDRLPQLHHGLHVFTSRAGDPWKIHTDTWPGGEERQCALNFGVQNCGKWGVTRFYSDPVAQVNTTHRASDYSTLIEGPLTKLLEHQLQNGEAAILDSRRPHAVTNYHPAPRVVLSWGISLPYEQAVPTFLAAFQPQT